MSQDVTFRNYLHEVTLKFHGNCHYGSEAFLTASWNNFVAVKIEEKREKNFKCLKDKVSAS